MLKHRVGLAAVFVLHMVVILVNVVGFFVLPFTWLILGIPFWFSLFLVMPLESIIIVLGFSREPCPLTRWENYHREKLGMPEVKGFIRYYLIKQKWRNQP